MLRFRPKTLLSFMVYLLHSPSFSTLELGTPVHAFNSSSFCRCLLKPYGRGLSPAPAKVAIIGGGITGAATAAFLRMLESDLANLRRPRHENGLLEPDDTATCRHLVVDIFESADRLGGRLDFAELEGAFVELGGADIHETNAWMVQFYDFLNAHLSEREQGETPYSGHASSNKAIPQFVKKLEPPDTSVRLLDGDDVVTVDFAAFKGRSDTVLFAAILQGAVDAWQRLYPLLGLRTCADFSGQNARVCADSSTVSGARCQRRHNLLPAFETATEMVREVNLSALLEQKLEDVLKTFQSPSLVNGIVDALVRGVYTQGTFVHALAGMVGLAGATGNLYAKRRPGRELVEFLTKLSVDHVFLNCQVKSIEERKTRREWQSLSGKTFSLKASETQCPVDTREYLQKQAYDFVVVATPLELSGLSFFRRNELGELANVDRPVPRTFQEIFVTFVAAEGILSTSPLNPTGGPTLTTSRESRRQSTGRTDLLLFASWCGHSLADEGKDGKPHNLICKLTTGRELTDADLSQLFRGVRRSLRRRWLAYPILQPIISPTEKATNDGKTANVEEPAEVSPTSFQLMENVFYPNAFEGVFSCIEGQAMAARNAAHLVLNAATLAYDAHSLLNSSL
ncbi:putative prenylcysteine oxidase [Neospora caninum Liverpool]|uniref:Prenylcysteine oxidase, putative n=1 Tax=Neospora caninum (strain Liverpool) TaxID=572307 RepID=F0VKK5_NEOCL|nr:putative prenylcysteine oxidase [Neospora caninum Liverpool]CBZ54606.1 putative prenylcysteine oxidase [Neospora caninum Liverpool]CEL69320.1 TPA: prenylcysteine oxidase, putative [Neospora caninum Liverpool]|eukprot:XP_003884636.1 putative prenylcysteine oxidase [Neospora caninum Liverpool]